LIAFIQLEPEEAFPMLQRLPLFLVAILLAFCFTVCFAGAAPSNDGNSGYRAPKSGGGAKTPDELADAAYNKGAFFQKKKEWTEAIRWYDKAVKYNGKFAQAYSNMAYCYRQGGEYEAAIKHYKRALHIDPKMLEARESLGQTYIRLAVASMKQTEKYMQLASKEWRQLREGKAVAHADKLEASIRKADELRRR
jgi:tetratricopeptide (TPR) repeat protein